MVKFGCALSVICGCLASRQVICAHEDKVCSRVRCGAARPSLLVLALNLSAGSRWLASPAGMARAEAHAPSLDQGFRVLFYLLGPNETSFAREEDVPAYVEKATPFFLMLMLSELFIGWAKTRSLVIRINDGITSLSAGIMSRLPTLFARSLELSCYVYVWNNYRLVELPWDSPWTWWLAFLGVDLGYYWLHRLSHDFKMLA